MNLGVFSRNVKIEFSSCKNRPYSLLKRKSATNPHLPNFEQKGKFLHNQLELFLQEAKKSACFRVSERK